MGVAILIVCGGAAISSLSKASRRRAFRDVSGTLAYAALSVVLLAIGVSAVVWPEPWNDLGRGILDVYRGGD